MNPRTLWACQSVAFVISASVAPLVRPIISRIFAPLLSARGAVAFSGSVTFLPVLAPFLVAAVRVLPPPAFFLPLEVLFFERAFRVATCAPCSATAAALSFASALVMVVFVILLALASRMMIHHF